MSAKELILELGRSKSSKRSKIKNLTLFHKPPKKTPKNSGRLERIKRPLAMMVILGRKTIDMALQFHTTPQTIRKWLDDPIMQMAITDMEQEMASIHDRQMHGLYGASIKRLHKMMKRSADSDAIEAIKMIWTAQGRYSPKGNSELNIYNQQMALSGGTLLNREDASNALALLRTMRKQDQPVQKQIPGAE